MLEPMYPGDFIYTKTRLRMPSTDQSSRGPPHRKKCTRTVNCFIDRQPGTGSAFIRSPCVFSNHAKSSGCRTFGIAGPITCAALDSHHRLGGAAHEEIGLQQNGTMSSLATNLDSILAMMTIGFVCGDPVVNASILILFCSGTPLPRLM
ncbi:uncharacterized protein TNCV_3882761 [Trichonephila clavipes]|nr:uncharacterized protein TNCV_3882761 [Trichonephila clavipes]